MIERKENWCFMKAYIIKLEFNHLQPEVWRRVIMPAGATFNRLHETIQRVTNFKSALEPYHYFAVEVEDLFITNNPILHEEHKGKKFGGRTVKQPSRLKVDGYLEKYGELLYTYDFGNDWQIQVALEETVEDYFFGYPTLLAGEGMAPPEDVGGPPGYEEFLKVYHNPQHLDYLSTYAWAASQSYLPLDDHKVNEGLKAVKYKKTEWQYIEHDNYVILSDKYRGTEFTRLNEQINKELVIQYILACVNLYGFIEHPDLLRIYNEQNERALSGIELRTVLTNLEYPNPLVKYNVSLYKDAFVHKEIEGLRFNGGFFQSIQGKPLYVPEKEELLRYADKSYYEKTSHQEKLASMMTKDFFGGSTLLVKEEIDSIVRQLKVVELDFNDFIKRFSGRFIWENTKHIEEYIQVLTMIANTTRIWVNRGYTPQELAQMEKHYLQQVKKNELQVIDGGKVGRNDSCPCGSGKKHKKCCGK